MTMILRKNGQEIEHSIVYKGNNILFCSCFITEYYKRMQCTYHIVSGLLLSMCASQTPNMLLNIHNKNRKFEDIVSAFLTPYLSNQFILLKLHAILLSQARQFSVSAFHEHVEWFISEE